MTKQQQCHFDLLILYDVLGAKKSNPNPNPNVLLKFYTDTPYSNLDYSGRTKSARISWREKLTPSF